MTDSKEKDDKISCATIKLYDKNAYETEFEATIESVLINNNRIELVLDRTLFFPEEGGQDSDTGKIEGFEVIDVQISNDIITHYIKYDAAAQEMLKPGNMVKGRINWKKRFSNMQNHTGEHILSGILHSEYKSENVGFHLSKNTVTLDTSRYLNEEELVELETKANNAVYADLDVRGEYLPEEELEKIEYRSKKEIDGAIRIVTIDKLDKCACCAPHVRHTGEVGVIKITKAIKWKNGTRIWFLCGSRALEYIQTIFKNVDEIVNITSEAPDKIAYGVKRFADNISELKMQLFEMQSEIIGEKIQNLDKIRKINSDIKTDVILFERELNPKVLRNAVNDMVERFDGGCGIFSENDNDSYQYIIGSKSRDCREINDILVKKLGAKGGGKKEMIQGSVHASKENIIEALKITFDI